MPQFVINPQRLNPYPNCNFLVLIDGHVVAGVNKVSPISRKTKVMSYQQGGDSNTVFKAPGRTDYDAITLEQGVTHDPVFEQWTEQVWSLEAGLGQKVSLQNFRKDITIQLLNEAGQPVQSYNLYRCWVSEYQALPELDASGNTTAFQHIKLEFEGFKRDPVVIEPVEPSFTP